MEENSVVAALIFGDVDGCLFPLIFDNLILEILCVQGMGRYGACVGKRD